jgi:hypothetical protein
LTYKDPHGGIGLPKGSGYGSKFFLPMITTSQSFYISFNLSEGLVSIYIFTTEQYYEYEFDLSFQPLIQIANITEFEGIIPI